MEDLLNPTYNLKAVVKETGIKPDTLRAWERRYGLPQPSRTSGKHRLYTQQDIDTLKWLVARQQEGLSISRAVNLYRSLEAEGHDPLLMPQYALPSQPVPAGLIQGNTSQELRKEWLEACFNFDEGRAELILNQAFALFQPEMVATELLGKGLTEVGAGWYEGKVSVQQEHFASEIAVRRLEALIAGAPSPNLFGKILIACPPGEQHTFSSLLLAYLVRRSGREVIYLGANVPNYYLDETIEATKPNLVVMISQMLITTGTLLGAARLLESRNVPLAFGGGIFNRNPTLQQRIPGHYLGEDLNAAVESIDRILRTNPRFSAIDSPEPNYQEAYRSFLEVEPKIRSIVHASLLEAGFEASQNVFTVDQFSQLLASALMLGDVRFLDSELQWIRQYLNNLGIPLESLSVFLDAFYRAIEEEMGARGTLIVEYLGDLQKEIIN